MDKHYPVVAEGRIVMRWGDMDAVGHVNNTTYFRYLEQVRLDWLESFGYAIDPAGTGPVLASTGCSFRKELVYPGTLRITIELEKLGKSSLKMRHRFFRDDDPDTVYATGEVALVWVDYASGKPVPVPADIRAALALHAEAEPA